MATGEENSVDAAVASVSTKFLVLLLWLAYKECGGQNVCLNFLQVYSLKVIPFPNPVKVMFPEQMLNISHAKALG